jgi:hypothetical protein
MLEIMYLGDSNFTKIRILKIREKDLIWMNSVWIGNKNPGHIWRHIVVRGTKLSVEG